MKISVVINTYNAEKHLKEVLDSAKDFDEIVICDMESTDNTLDIAKEYNCKIVTFPKDKYTIVEPARNFAIQQATQKWILVVDADEVIPMALKDYLYDIIKSSNPPAGIYIPRKNYFMGQFMHCYYPDYILRFFKKEGTIWPPYIHTIPIVQGRIENIPKRKKEMAFIHLSNDPVYDLVRKMNQYTENEREKRRNKNYGIGALIFRPFFAFFKSYIIKKGFLDGKPGFICAIWNGFYKFIVLAKLEEDKRNGRDLQ